jgi:predicted nucleic acid-binding protein
MSDRAFFDSNVLIYAIVSGDSRRERAQQLVAQGGVISVQVLNEFVAVARRKMRVPWEDLIDALGAVRILFPFPVAITIATHEAALEIARKYGFGIYDAMIVSSAIEENCSTLYSEDLQDGQVVDGKLTIRNPFR